MGQFSVEIYALPGSLLSGNQHFNELVRRELCYVARNRMALIRWVEICAVGSGRIAIEFDCRRDLEASCLKPKGQASASSE